MELELELELELDELLELEDEDDDLQLGKSSFVVVESFESSTLELLEQLPLHLFFLLFLFFLPFLSEELDEEELDEEELDELELLELERESELDDEELLLDDEEESVEDSSSEEMTRLPRRRYVRRESRVVSLVLPSCFSAVRPFSPSSELLLPEDEEDELEPELELDEEEDDELDEEDELSVELFNMLEEEDLEESEQSSSNMLLLPDDELLELEDEEEELELDELLGSLRRRRRFFGAAPSLRRSPVTGQMTGLMPLVFSANLLLLETGALASTPTRANKAARTANFNCIVYSSPPQSALSYSTTRGAVNLTDPD